MPMSAMGLRTTPKSKFSDVSGVRLEFPPNNPSPCVLQVAGVNGGMAPRMANTTNLWFESIDGETLVISLDLKGLAVSSGAACSSGANEPSHVLLAMGLSAERAQSSVRFSLHRMTTEEDIDQATNLVASQVARLRELSAVAR